MSIGWVIVAFWVSGCVFGMYKVVTRPTSGERSPEHMLSAVAFLLLAAAPVLSLALYQFTPVDHYWAGLGPLLGALLVIGIRTRLRAQRIAADEDLSVTRFREKSARLMFAALLVLTAGSVIYVLLNGVALIIPTIMASTILLIVAAIIGHGVIAALHAPMEETDTPADEFDESVNSLSMRNAYYVMMVGIWAILATALLGLPAHVLALVSFSLIAIAELTYYGSMVRYYRVGVD